MPSESSSSGRPSLPARQRRSPAEEDQINESGVLDALINDYPELYTEAELIRELARGRDDWRCRDGLERAITSLEASGLVNRCGPLLIPSHAARCYEDLRW